MNKAPVLFCLESRITTAAFSANKFLRDIWIYIVLFHAFEKLKKVSFLTAVSEKKWLRFTFSNS